MSILYLISYSKDCKIPVRTMINMQNKISVLEENYKSLKEKNRIFKKTCEELVKNYEKLDKKYKKLKLKE